MYYDVRICRFSFGPTFLNTNRDSPFVSTTPKKQESVSLSKKLDGETDKQFIRRTFPECAEITRKRHRQHRAYYKLYDEDGNHFASIAFGRYNDEGKVVSN